MQIQNANVEGDIKSVFRAVRHILQHFLPVFPTSQPKQLVSVTDQSSTQVVAETKPRLPRVHGAKRFRRTEREIELGLSIEEAMASRTAARSEPVVKKPQVETKTTKPVEQKALKRFRRTAAEIEAGLTIEQAAAARGVQLPGKPKKIYVERKVELKPLASTDLITTLSPRIQARANVMTTMRRRGVQGAISSEMLDLAAAAVAAGKVTKCEPFIDSDGYNHLTGQEGK
jgi:hypothetical protein